MRDLELMIGGQQGPFARLGEAYGRDARAAVLRATALAILAAIVLLLFTAWGAVAIDAAMESGNAWEPGLAIASLGIVGSAPIWWFADRNRRSAAENRRLQRHAATIEPFLAGFGDGWRDHVRLLLAQRLFARSAEDNDPLTRPQWTVAE